MHDHDVRRRDEGVDAEDIVQDGLDATAGVAHEYDFCNAIRSVPCNVGPAGMDEQDGRTSGLEA